MGHLAVFLGANAPSGSQFQEGIEEKVAIHHRDMLQDIFKFSDTVIVHDPSRPDFSVAETVAM